MAASFSALHNSVVKVVYIWEHFLLSGDQEGIVALWDLQSNSNVFFEKEHTGQIMGLSFMEELGLIISTSSDGIILLWNTSGVVLYEFDDHTNWVSGVITRGRQMISYSYDNTLISWTIHGDEIEKLEFTKDAILKGHTYFIIGCLFYKTNTNIALSFSYDGTARKWNISDSSCIGVLQHSNDSRINHGCMSPDERFFASAGEDGKTLLWDLQQLRLLYSFSHLGSVRGVTFSFNSMQLFSASEDKTIAVLCCATGKKLDTLVGHTDQVNRCVTTKLCGDDVLVSISNDKTVRFWKDGNLLYTNTIHKHPVVCLAKDPSEMWLATGSLDRCAISWNLCNRT